MGWFTDLFKSKAKKEAEMKELDSKLAATDAKKGKVNTRMLNAREHATKTAKVLFKLKKHTIVSVVASNSEWYKVSTTLGDAFCMKKYIDIQDVIEKVLVEAKLLNVRSFYSTDASILGTVKKGEILLKISKHDNWYGVDFKGQTGYVCADYATLLNDSASGSGSKATPKQEEARQFFNARKDLAKVDLAPKRQLSADGQDKYGKVAVKTWNNFGNIVTVISKELGIEVERALAVICVESGGSAFGSDGRMLIRFENHVFYTYYGSKSDDKKEKFDEHFTFDEKTRRNGHKFRAKKNQEWTTSHNGQGTEWDSLDIARKLGDTEALYSISMGAPQVMGFNYKTIGYQSVQDMFNAFSKDIRYHVMALFDFIAAKSSRVQYLITGDFLSFAKEYNGLSAPEAYQERLEQYYDIYKKILKA